MNLKSIDEYRAGFKLKPPEPTTSPTGVACPKCGAEMYVINHSILASNPPQKVFLCQSCNHTEYVPA